MCVGLRGFRYQLNLWAGNGGCLPRLCFASCCYGLLVFVEICFFSALCSTLVGIGEGDTIVFFFCRLYPTSNPKVSVFSGLPEFVEGQGG